jgi:acetylcholinesterase
VNDYLRSYMIPTASKGEIDVLLQYYPGDPSAGSPFETGLKNVLSMLTVVNSPLVGLS